MSVFNEENEVDHLAEVLKFSSFNEYFSVCVYVQIKNKNQQTMI